MTQKRFALATLRLQIDVVTTTLIFQQAGLVNCIESCFYNWTTNYNIRNNINC
jgi:hypothetical protein